MPPTLLQFTPFSSLTHPSFWHKLTQLKLDVLKLSDDEVTVSATYSVGRQIKDREKGGSVGVDGSLSVEESSFESDAKSGIMTVHASGIVKNYNTIEDFKAADKQALFAKCADEVRNCECSRSAHRPLDVDLGLYSVGAVTFKA